jgi:hypothetical protein
MNSFQKIPMVSRRVPIDRGKSLNRWALKEHETMKHVAQRLLLAVTLAVVIVVPGLPYHASADAADTLDQSQTVSQSPQTVHYDLQRAQIFTAGMYGALDRVSLRLENYVASPPVGASLNVSIQTVIDGVPSGKQIGSGTIPLSAIPAYGSGGAWVDVEIGGAVVHAGTQYAIVLQTSLWNAVVTWWYAYENAYGSSYTGGEMVSNYGDGWSTAEIYDFSFQTYVIPDVLDQSQTKSNGGISGGTLGQTFTAGLSGVLDRVSVFLQPLLPEGPLQASIQTVTEEGYPSGIMIGQGSIPASSLPPNYWGGWVTIGISGAIVHAGTQYALVLQEESGQVIWSLVYYAPYAGGDMMFIFNEAQGWTTAMPGSSNPVDAVFQTYVVTSLPSIPPPPPPATSTPCSSGVCPAVRGSVTPKDSTARVTSNINFRGLPDGTVEGVLNFNDSKTGDLVLQGCATHSAACRLTVTTFACTDEHAITVAGTYTPKGGTAADYLLTLSGVKDGIGTFTLTVGNYTYTVAHDGIVNVTCP